MGLNQLLPAALLLAPLAIAVDRTVSPQRNLQLRNAATNYDRHQILTTNDDWTFDFNHAKPVDAYKPGSVKNANAATFPALQGLGMTLAQLNLGPCAMLAPHLHPRATNLVVAVAGDTTTYMYNENGVKTVTTRLTPGVMTIFPRGSLHAMQNNGCENATLISALDSEDSGTLNILNGLWELPRDMIRAAFGNRDFDIDDLGMKIPEVGTGSVLGSQECLKKCGMSV